MVVVSDWVDGRTQHDFPADVGKTYSATVGWGISVNVGVGFGGITASLGVNYNESITETTNIGLHIDMGKIGRLVYIPFFHYVKGKITVVKHELVVVGHMGPFGQPITEEKLVTLHDHETVEIYMPIKKEGCWSIQLQGEPAPGPCIQGAGDQDSQ